MYGTEAWYRKSSMRSIQQQQPSSQQQQKRVGSQVEDPPFSRYFNVHVCVGLIVRFSFPCYSTASAICAALWSSYIPYSNQCYSFLPLAHPRVPCIILQSCIALDVCILLKYTHIRDQLFTKNHFFRNSSSIFDMEEYMNTVWCGNAMASYGIFSLLVQGSILFFFSFIVVNSVYHLGKQLIVKRKCSVMLLNCYILDVLTLHLQDNKILSNGRQGQSLI